MGEKGKLLIVLHVDCEPAAEEGNCFTNPAHPWRYDYEEAIAGCNNIFAVALEEGVPITWLIFVERDRTEWVDKLVEYKLIHKWIERGHEIGIHPHHFIWDVRHRRWEENGVDVCDPEKFYEDVIFGCKRLVELGVKVKSYKGGYHQMNNYILAALRRSDIKYTFFLPVNSKKRPYEDRVYYDWKGVSWKVPYFMDQDYRKRGNKGVLAVPIGIYRKLWRKITANWAISIRYLEKIVDDYIALARKEGLAILGVFTHNWQKRGSPENLKKFIDMCRDKGNNIDFSTLSDACERWIATQTEKPKGR